MDREIFIIHKLINRIQGKDETFPVFYVSHQIFIIINESNNLLFPIIKEFSVSLECAFYTFEGCIVYLMLKVYIVLTLYLAI